MTFTVYYIDDRANPKPIEANTAEMAAWRFVHQYPRTDTSQITVDSQPSVSWRSPAVTHYRACDLLNTPAPSNVPEPDLVMRFVGGPEPGYVVSGSIESLRILATGLTRAIDSFPTRSNPLNSKHVYEVSVLRGDGSQSGGGLSFAADPDIAQYWARRPGFLGFWTEYGRWGCLVLFAAFACIGIWTVARWIL